MRIAHLKKFTSLCQSGYTLVELVIVISIIIILTTFVYSGYTKSQEKQIVLAAKETLMSDLQAMQKAAYVGNRDCTGPFLDIKVVFTPNSNTLTATAECVSTSGTPQSKSISSIKFVSIPDIMFRPLEQGVTFSSGSSANVDYIIGTKTYRITVSPPGTITYIGAL